MVVGAFPAAKLGALLLKQISKPIANAAKSHAKSNPFFRKYVCMPPAQFYNWCEVKAKMWILNLGKPVNIPVLNEAMAIELGANLLGEGIIFIIAAGVLISEYTRSVRKEEAKEQAKRDEMTSLQNTIRELFIQSEEQGAHIRELTRRLGELDIVDTKLQKINFEPKLSPKDKPKELIFEKEDTSVFINDINLHEVGLIKESTLPHNAGLILNAVNDIENEFWQGKEQMLDENILTLGLLHILKNVLKLKSD